ncbi:DUF3450 domain-containing protein [Vibrio sinensis]|uniref:DUF3450 domain-containing protein n=1 Tax=Vibrio sinensis TaxID=2302434 RepID=A0A3A6QD89_9VIBR|nr:DUF3450 domain-containing protein [Vibrio sinensis]RJX65769.1 DUF3450 domain-containing protein [Vibrio sinensis]
MNLIKTSAAVLMATFLSSAQATSLDKAQSIQSQTNASSASSQNRISQSADNTLALQAEIEQLTEEVKNLDIYQKHLTALVNSQQQETASLEAQIEEIKVTRQGIVPLMYQMLDGLRVIMAEDAPIKLAQREERIEKLDSMMTRADISDAEKYRRILEAYQIEMDYGTKIGLYQGQIALPNMSIEADVLHLGRISLVARSLNGNKFWAWNQSSKQWQELDSGLKPELDKAYAVAANQTAPSLITLPVSLNVTSLDIKETN